MSILCDEPRRITNPNTLIGSYFAEDLPDISPDDQRYVISSDGARALSRQLTPAHPHPPHPPHPPLPQAHR